MTRFCSLVFLILGLSLSVQAQGKSEAYLQYDRFNATYLDSAKYIYKDKRETPQAVDRWHGAAAIWCQAIFFDMAVQAYACARQEGDKTRMKQYREHAYQLFLGNQRQYVNFNFEDPNTNTGWFVYDDIMWWSIALTHAYQAFGKKKYLRLAKKSFERVWKGSGVVGDDGSYADPQRGLGGGMFWEWQPIEHPKPHHAGDFRSACINFPTVIAACLLYQSTHQQIYLHRALEIYQWADSTLVREGRVADGIHGGGPEWKDHLYNQATYIGASSLLYHLTHQWVYLNKAKQAAIYTRTMSLRDILPREYGPEQGVYTAIFSQYGGMYFDFSPSILYYETQQYDDVYQASGLPALLLFGY